MISFSVTGLGFGDEGKGTTVDWLCREYGIGEVVRFNGGAQAAHHVATADGKFHCFAQWGSGTFAGARTYLGPRVLVDLLTMGSEADHLVAEGVPNPWELLSVDANAVLVTPYHQALNVIREVSRGEDRHGSCHMGIGETRADQKRGFAIRAGDLRDERRLVELLAATRSRLLDDAHAFGLGGGRIAGTEEAYETFENWYPEGTARLMCDLAERFSIEDAWEPAFGAAVFEGAQGVLLDESLGFYPYVTWSPTAAAPSSFEIARLDGPLIKVGVTRGYATRHGAGPFVTESESLTRALAPRDSNGATGPQGPLRVGQPDLVALRYAVDVGGPFDALAVTCLDHRPPGIDDRWAICQGYRRAGRSYSGIRRARGLADGRERTAQMFESTPVYGDRVESRILPDVLGRALGLPVLVKSWGPTAEEKIGLPVSTLTEVRS